eukprot:symbB.v1.2.021083.t1/scaffold1805.1/size100715/2
MLMETAANFSQQGKHEKALSTLETAQEFLEAAGYPDSLAAGYFIQHGSAFANLKRFGEAMQEFGKARDIFKKHHHLQSPDGITVSGNMAIAAAAVGRRKDAMMFFHEASAGLDARNDELGKARILSSMGAASVASGEVEAGLSHMKQAWQAILRAKLGNTLEGAVLLSQMGSILYQMALYSQANMSFELARDRYFQNGNFMEALRMTVLSVVSNVRGWLWETEHIAVKMEDWDPFADPAEFPEITVSVVEETDAKSIYDSRWEDKGKNEAIMAALPEASTKPS